VGIGKEKKQKTSLENKHFNNKRSLILLLFLFIFYILIEFIGAYLSSSLALLADAGHMIIDSSAIILGIFALMISQIKPTNKNSYGYLRAEIIGALINGFILFGLSAFILYNAVKRFENPPSIKGNIMTFVAFGGLLINIIGLFLLHSSKDKNLNVKGVWLHILSDTLGSLVAFFGAIFIWLFGWNLIDPILSIFLSIFILIGALKLLLDCVNILFESTPPNIDLEKVRTDMKKIEGVIGVHDLHIWSLSSGFFCVTAHVDIKCEKDQQKILKELISYFDINYGINHVTFQLEPVGFNHRKLGF